MTIDRKAGRELDRLIAEKVMGWKCTETRTGIPHSIINPEIVTEHWETADGRVALWDDGDRNNPFSPSIDIGHAWDVVDRMLSLNRFLRLDRVPDGWWAGFSANSLTPGETAQLAICYAALSALGFTVKS